MNINDKERRSRFIVFGVIFLVSLAFFVTCLEKNWLGLAGLCFITMISSVYAIFSGCDEDSNVF